MILRYLLSPSDNHYLKEIAKPHSAFLKVLRSETHTIPKGTRKQYTSIDLFETLQKTLEKKGEKPTGFTHFALPNID